MWVDGRWGGLALVCAIGLVAGCGDEGASGPTTGGHADVLQSCNPHSGYPGDDLCLKPPDPDVGFQLHFGPQAYDAASIEPYIIAPGEENVQCVYMKTPNDRDIFVDEFHGRIRPGSHHMITYLLDQQVADQPIPSNCSFVENVSSTFLLGSQEPEVDIVAEDQAPEHQGYALKIPANSQVRIELHYINTTLEPILREAWINVRYVPDEDVTKEMGPLFWIAQLSKVIDPRSVDLMQGTCMVPMQAPDDLELVQITGHFHAHTRRMTAWLTDAFRPTRCTKGTMPGEEDLDGCTRLYEGYQYTDPGWITFDSETDNRPPDPDQRVPGGDYDGNLPLHPGQRIDWECEIHNDLDTEIRFANEAQTAEMCNIFGTYAPNMGGPWSCYQ